MYFMHFEASHCHSEWSPFPRFACALDQQPCSQSLAEDHRWKEKMPVRRRRRKRRKWRRRKKRRRYTNQALAVVAAVGADAAVVVAVDAAGTVVVGSIAVLHQQSRG